MNVAVKQCPPERSVHFKRDSVSSGREMSSGAGSVRGMSAGKRKSVDRLALFLDKVVTDAPPAADPPTQLADRLLQRLFTRVFDADSRFTSTFERPPSRLGSELLQHAGHGRYTCRLLARRLTSPDTVQVDQGGGLPPGCARYRLSEQLTNEQRRLARRQWRHCLATERSDVIAPDVIFKWMLTGIKAAVHRLHMEDQRKKKKEFSYKEVHVLEAYPNIRLIFTLSNPKRKENSMISFLDDEDVEILYQREPDAHVDDKSETGHNEPEHDLSKQPEKADENVSNNRGSEEPMQKAPGNENSEKQTQAGGPLPVPEQPSSNTTLTYFTNGGVQSNSLLVNTQPEVEHDELNTNPLNNSYSDGFESDSFASTSIVLEGDSTSRVLSIDRDSVILDEPPHVQTHENSMEKATKSINDTASNDKDTSVNTSHALLHNNNDSMNYRTPDFCKMYANPNKSFPCSEVSIDDPSLVIDIIPSISCIGWPKGVTLHHLLPKQKPFWQKGTACVNKIQAKIMDGQPMWLLDPAKTPNARKLALWEFNFSPVEQMLSQNALDAWNETVTNFSLDSLYHIVNTMISQHQWTCFSIHLLDRIVLKLVKKHISGHQQPDLKSMWLWCLQAMYQVAHSGKCPSLLQPNINIAGDMDPAAAEMTAAEIAYVLGRTHHNPAYILRYIGYPQPDD